MPFQSTVGDYQTVATLETFGFLPPMTQEEIYDQIAYIIAQGWSPVIEHVHPSGSMQTYWSYWKLPFFGEKDLGHHKLGPNFAQTDFPLTPLAITLPIRLANIRGAEQIGKRGKEAHRLNNSGNFGSEVVFLCL